MTENEFADWQLALIEELRVARLATIRSDGSPHLVPACYAFQGGQFSIPVDEKPKASRNLARLRNIDGDERVTLLFDRYDDDWTRLAWVRVDGRATVLPRGDAEPTALEQLRRRYPQYISMDLDNLPLIVIEPISVAAWRWRSG
ncbi:MAG: TIGR03668 family PPOX class F420-dependent oxidoreductase [Dehalococcoidia bacterium]